MGIKNNVFTTNDLYDLVNDGCITYQGLVENSLYMWGSNTTGTLGDGTRNDRSSPVQISGTTWCCVNAAGWTGALKSDGTAWNWGETWYNATSGTSLKYSSPVQLPGTNWCVISTGNMPGGALINTSNELCMFGCNQSGALGQSNTTTCWTYVNVPGSWSDIRVGYAAIGLRTDGTLWTWGDNSFGALGQGGGFSSYSCKTSPVQIPGTWSSIVSADGGGYLTAAVKSDNTMWGWGRNYYGAIGNGNRIDYSSPIQIPGTWLGSSRVGTYYSIGFKPDGTAWVWGGNDAYGTLGINHRTNMSSPVQLPGTNWCKGGTSRSGMMMALKTDGTLWSWGRNDGGKLGQNNTIHRSSPVQISGAGWCTLTTNFNESHGGAIKQTIF